MPLHDRLHDRQSESAARWDSRACAGGVGLVEPVEDVRQVLGRNARSVVLHDDAHMIGVARGQQGQPSAVGNVSNRVGREVLEGLLETLRVAVNREVRRIDRQRQGDPAIAGCRPVTVDDPVEQIADRHVFEHQRAAAALEPRDPALRAQLLIVELAEMERAIVWKDGRVLQILGPGRHAFWKTSTSKLDVEVYSIDQKLRFEHPRLQAILQVPDAQKFFQGVVATDHEDVLLYRDGVLIDRLGEGLHVFWKGTGKVRYKAIDRREQVADVAGQEIMTADKVTLRVNLIVSYLVSDVVKAVALGAKAVLIGRAYLWGLAANGQAGVENVLDVLSGGIDSALRGLGLASTAELRPEHLLVPEGFDRALGLPTTAPAST